MPNPVPAKYTKQMAVMVPPEVGGEVGAWGEQRGAAHSQILREVVEAGLKALRPRWKAQYGALDPAMLAEHVRRCTRQGGQQVSRRRDYDDNRRGGEGTTKSDAA